LLPNWLSHALPWSIVNPSRADSFSEVTCIKQLHIPVDLQICLLNNLYSCLFFVYLRHTFTKVLPQNCHTLIRGWGGGLRGYFSSCQKGGPMMSKTIASDGPLALAQWFVIGPRCVRLSHGLIRLGMRLNQTPAVYQGTFDVFFSHSFAFATSIFYEKFFFFNVQRLMCFFH
jgi:hypothetical protein